MWRPWRPPAPGTGGKQIRLGRKRRPMVDGRFVNRPYECQALYGAWQYVRLFWHLLNRN